MKSRGSTGCASLRAHSRCVKKSKLDPTVILPNFSEQKHFTSIALRDILKKIRQILLNTSFPVRVISKQV